MPQEASVAVSLRRNLSRRRSSRSVGDVDRDDRGWNLLHIGARKGDLKQVIFFLGGGVILISLFTDFIERGTFLSRYALEYVKLLVDFILNGCL